MARNTQWVRDAWAPACRGRGVSLRDAYRALDAWFRAFGYRPKAGQTWGYNCRRITGGSGYSLHAYEPDERFVFWTGVLVTMAIAVDVNSLANPYGPRLVTDMQRKMIDGILGIRTVDGIPVFGWGGYYSRNKDAMHFEIKVSPAELARGIDWSTVPGGEPGGEEDWFDMATKDELADVVDDRIAKHGRFLIEVTQGGEKVKKPIDAVLLEIAQALEIVGPDPVREWKGSG